MVRPLGRVSETTNNNTSFHSSISLFACDFSSEDFVWAAEGAAHAGGLEAAKRATPPCIIEVCTRGQRMDRAGEVGTSSTTRPRRYGPCPSTSTHTSRDMSIRASQWPCPQPPTTASTRWRLAKRTTAHGHRRRTGPGLRTTLYGDRRKEQPGGRSSSSCLRKSLPGCGQGRSPTLGRRSGFSGTQWSTSTDLMRVAPMVQISRCTSAADDGQPDGCLPSHGSADCRAGNRSAQDHCIILSLPGWLFVSHRRRNS